MRLFLHFSIIFVCIFSMISCGKKFEYAPLEASAVSNSLHIYIEDKNGNNLINNPIFTDNLTIYSEESRTSLDKKIVELDDKSYLSIRAPFPNKNKHKIPVGDQENIKTKIKLYIEGKEYELICIFTYYQLKDVPSGMIGDTSMQVQTILFNGETFDPKHVQLSLGF